MISIHPPRAGRDLGAKLPGVRGGHFNPPAPCGAGPVCLDAQSRFVQFQSTRPVRGGTAATERRCAPTAYFNPPAPCGAGPYLLGNGVTFAEFQSTRPVRGGTMCGRARGLQRLDFNPPAPCGAGRIGMGPTISQHRISIHPPRAGRDGVCGRTVDSCTKFQSTRPVRGGTCKARFKVSFGAFQSTRPVRGGTCRCRASRSCPPISIHPPRAGRDQADQRKRSRNGYFNPPAPCGAGQQSCTKFTPCILAQYTIQRAAKLLSAYQQAYFC